MDLSRELQIATQLALDAGKLALAMQKTSWVKQKPDYGGPVTEADIETDKLIRERLENEFPSDCVVTEETFQGNESVLTAHRVWFVDPIDGTQDYVAGGNDYAVMIGLCIDGTPTLGVVFQPTTNKLWQGVGTTLAKRIDSNGAFDLEIADRYVNSAGPVLAISLHHHSVLLDYLAQEIRASHIIKKGSVGLKIALIADGLADIYIASTRRIKLWDTCAPHAILRAAGGVLKNINHEELSYQKTISHGTPIYASTLDAEMKLKADIDRIVVTWQQMRKSKNP